jgi:hypothetical protein
MRSRDATGIHGIAASYSIHQRWTAESYVAIIEALQSILKDEKAIGEEYLTLLHFKVRLVEEDDPALRRILGDIASDEEKHQELVRLVMDCISR